MDKQLEELYRVAIAAKVALWDAEQAIENHVGRELPELCHAIDNAAVAYDPAKLTPGDLTVCHNEAIGMP